MENLLISNNGCVRLCDYVQDKNLTRRVTSAKHVTHFPYDQEINTVG